MEGDDDGYGDDDNGSDLLLVNRRRGRAGGGASYTRLPDTPGLSRLLKRDEDWYIIGTGASTAFFSNQFFYLVIWHK